MTPVDRELLRSAVDKCDEHLRLHKELRHQSVALMVTLDGVGLAVLSTIDDHYVRIVGCMFVLALTSLLWFIGEKELTMVMFYTGAGNCLATELSPETYATIARIEEQVQTAMTGERHDERVKRLRGALGAIHRTPFRIIWRAFTVAVVLLILFVTLKPFVV